MLKKIFYLLIALVAFLPINAFALNCPYEKVSRLKALAQNVKYSYDYYYDGDMVKFNIRFYNLHPDIAIKDVTHDKIYYFDGTNNNELILNDFKDGQQNKFVIYSRNGLTGTNVYYILQVVDGVTVKTPITSGVQYSCDIEELLTIYVQTPSYNRFYNSPICKKYNDNKLCYKWYDNDMTYEEFEKKLLDDVNKQENNNNKKKENQEFKYNFVPWIILGSTILICFSLLGIYVYRNRKNGFEGW